MNEQIQGNIFEPFDSATYILGEKIYNILKRTPSSFKKSVQEIRIRTQKEIILQTASGAYFVDENSNISPQNLKNSLKITKADLSEIFNRLCNYSIYSYQNELKNGFITIKGGHRVGICASALYNQGKLAGVRDISSLNIRIARDIKGAAENLFKKLDIAKGKVLIYGRPSSGKTTILRDIARKLSTSMKKVCIIDQRGEIAAQFNGISQNDIGFCDVLNGYEKSDGMMLAIRSLSPDIIICDEISTVKEASAMVQCLNCGVNIITTIHADNLKELEQRDQYKILTNHNVIDFLVELSAMSPCKINKIYKVSDLNAENFRGNFNNNSWSYSGFFAG